jgi:hypothetical protein
MPVSRWPASIDTVDTAWGLDNQEDVSMENHTRAHGPTTPKGVPFIVAARSMMAAGVLRLLLRTILVTWLVFMSICAYAQAPVASVDTPPPLPSVDLDKLVAPIALYPDDLIAIILPAATYPLEVVQADRFLEQRKSNKSLAVNESWQEPVKSLLNYPDVVKKMSSDLDWTVSLGEAVVSDQSAVLEAVQRFRRQTKSAGHLKSDDKQVVVVEKEIIKIVPADPQVIYVPQYNPTTVVVSGGTPYGYLPAPYPAYYYPYPPGAALATGLIWGAAISAAWNGGHYETNYGGGGNNNINVNREKNVNRGNINTGDINRSRGQSAQSGAWKSEKKPGQVGGGTGRAANSPRVGDPPARGGGASNIAAGGARPTNQRGASVNTREQGNISAQPARGGAGNTQAGGARAANQRGASMNAREQGNMGAQTRGGNAFGGYGSARDTTANSARGAASRQSMSSARGQSAHATGRAGGGAGGGRAGGGARPSGGGRAGGGGRR